MFVRLSINYVKYCKEMRNTTEKGLFLFYVASEWRQLCAVDIRDFISLSRIFRVNFLRLKLFGIKYFK
jgi:hypothetical protein